LRQNVLAFHQERIGKFFGAYNSLGGVGAQEAVCVKQTGQGTQYSDIFRSVGGGKVADGTFLLGRYM